MAPQTFFRRCHSQTRGKVDRSSFHAATMSFLSKQKHTVCHSKKMYPYFKDIKLTCSLFIYAKKKTKIDCPGSFWNLSNNVLMLTYTKDQGLYHMDSWTLTKAPRNITVQQEHYYLCWLLIDGCHWQRWMVGGGGRGQANSAYACNTLHSLTLLQVTIFGVSIERF